MRSADFLNRKGPSRPRVLVYQSQQIRSLAPHSSPAELDWALPFCCPWFSSANKCNASNHCNNFELLSSRLRFAACRAEKKLFGYSCSSRREVRLGVSGGPAGDHSVTVIWRP